MSAGTQLQFYRARADQAREDANAATLAHVRERCWRSVEAWEALASRAAKSEEFRAAEAIRKADITAETRHDNIIQTIGPAGPQDPR
jgi:hypothetical protein